jgi:L-threonylcarbamoyladenylate synthase
MSRRYDCADASERAAGLAAAAAAVSRGELVVLPTDTVYGVGADAFNPVAVTCLLAAKGRGRSMPPPVLVGSVRAAVALVDDLGPFGKDFVEEFWPGGLTLVCHATPTLHWDLGDTRGTVAVRMPMHPIALDLLRETGPLAVSSANRSGSLSATTVAEAEEQLGDSVAVYLDGGPCSSALASTIVDLTGSVPRLLRKGVISVDRLRAVAGVSTGEYSTVTADDDGDASRDPAAAGADAATAGGGDFAASGDAVRSPATAGGDFTASGDAGRSPATAGEDAATAGEDAATAGEDAATAGEDAATAGEDSAAAGDEAAPQS